MNRRVSRFAAVFLALAISLTAPTAFAASRDRGMDPGFGTQIVRMIKSLAHKLGIVVFDDSSINQGPPIPKP